MHLPRGFRTEVHGHPGALMCCLTPAAFLNTLPTGETIEMFGKPGAELPRLTCFYAPPHLHQMHNLGDECKVLCIEPLLGLFE